MNRPHNTPNASDVSQYESLRQSELVSRLTAHIQKDLNCVADIVISRAIAQWLLDNDLRITKR